MSISAEPLPEDEVGSLIPPHNLDATHWKDAYPLEGRILHVSYAFHEFFLFFRNFFIFVVNFIFYIIFYTVNPRVEAILGAKIQEKNSRLYLLYLSYISGPIYYNFSK